MQKITLKLSPAAFAALHALYAQQVVPWQPQTPLHKLLYTLNLQVWAKLRRMDCLEVKKRYLLPLTPAEAQAFALYWSNAPPPITTLPGVVVAKLTAELHRQYA